MSQLTSANFQAYDPANASTIEAGPLALYSVSVDSILPTQQNEGYAEVDAKAAAYDLFSSLAQVEADLLGDVEPVVIGPGGQLYLLDGHHTFTALIDSVWGASNPTVYVNVIANYSNLTTSEFYATMQANNFLLPLNNGTAETVNDATGSPLPTSLTGLTNDPYRGLEYEILKNKSSKLFLTTSNITGAVGSAKPGLDKMPGLYSDFFEAAAYQDAIGGLGLPYLSPGDIALATDWNLTASSTTTLPNISGTVKAAQLPGFILAQNLTVSSVISNSTLDENGAAPTDPNGNYEAGALAGDGTFTGVTEINAGTNANPILIGTPNVGFVMQLGSDNGYSATLSNTANTYTGGTTILAGDLVIAADGSLGAAPSETLSQFNASLTFDAENLPDNVKSAVQADGGIIFNSLSEGNGTLTIGTAAGQFTAASPFTTTRPIAVGNEAATINVNGSVVDLDGPLITLGYDGLGLGETTGFPALTIDDLSTNGGKTATAGTVVLSTASPYFYGDIIIGNTGTPTVEVMNDAALGNTTGNALTIGEVELNGGTLQTGASFTASERNIVLDSGSQIDVDGNTTSWGTLTDVKRTIAVVNSSTTAGAITFNSLDISQTSTLQLDGLANSTTYSGAETVTLTNGVAQTASTDTLVISAAALGSTEKLMSGTGTSTLIDGIAPVWIISDNGASTSSNPYNFVTYGANGYVAATYTDTGSGSSGGIRTATSSSVVDQTGNGTLAANAQAYALKINNGAVITATGHTITLGDGTDPAGLIMDGGSAAITGGTLAFGGSQAIIYAKGSSTISAAITGTNGLTLAGSGTLTLGAASAGLSGAVTIDSGTLSLTAANVFASDTAGLELDDVKSSPSNSILNFTANQTFTTLDSAGSKSAITFSNGATLTIGDTTNNLSSTLSSAITETSTGGGTAGALTFDGSGLFDLSGMSSGTLTLVSGSSIAVNNSADLRVVASEFANANFGITLNGTSQLQFAQSGGGQFANAVSGAGELHLIGGTLQITGTSNTYSGGTVVETGSTLDITTANLPSINENITDAGGLIVFDQSTSGTFTGVISDGQEMGTGPSLAGSLDKDDSSGNNSGNVTLTAVQDYSGATYIEAGTLTLGTANAIADSSGVTLGRVGGADGTTPTANGGATAILALSANNQLNSLSDDAGNTTLVQLNGHKLTLTPATGIASDFGGVISDGATAGGSLVVNGAGTVTLGGDNTYSGGTTVTGASTLEIGASGAAGTGAIDFSGSGGTLKIDSATMPTNTIDGVVESDIIDLTGIAYDATGSVNLLADNVLQIVENSHTYDLQLSPTQNFAGKYFAMSQDSSTNGTDIEEQDTPCYCRGTRILTTRGEIAVEDLAIGDEAVTASGAIKPIVWIGKGRSLVTPMNPGARPIIVRQNALSEGVPSRDLYLTKAHSLYLDGVLIPVEHLLNGHSILWDTAAQVVEFYHVELPSHDVLIADGAPAESYKEEGNQLGFLNADRPTDIARSDWYATVLSSGPIVAAAWRRLLDRSGFAPPALTDDPDLHVLADGIRIDAQSHADGSYRFRLERAPFDLRIVSRGSVPRAIGRGHDIRRLGVAVRSLKLSGAELTAELPFDSPLLAVGFHNPEAERTMRWTNGNAAVPTRALIAFAGAFELTVHVVATLPYPAIKNDEKVRAAA
jgi:autotransporter-associated beta strand protein